MSLREIGLLRLVNVYLWTPPCYFVAISNLYFQFLSTVLWYGRQLLNVTCFMFLRAMYIRWPLFILIRVSFRCIIDVMLLGLVCCTRLVQTIITVCAASSICACTRVRHSRAATAAYPLDLEVSRCRKSQFARCFMPAQIRMWIDLPYTVFYTGTLDGFKGTVNYWLRP